MQILSKEYNLARFGGKVLDVYDAYNPYFNSILKQILTMWNLVKPAAETSLYTKTDI